MSDTIKSEQAETTPPPSDTDLFAEFANLGAPKAAAEETPPKEVPFTQMDGPTELPQAGTKKRNTQLKRQIADLYVFAGTTTFMFDQQIGGLVIQQADACAESLDELARTNPAVKRALEKLLETSIYGAVLAAHAPIVIAVATKYVPYLRKSYEDTVDNYNAAASENVA